MGGHFPAFFRKTPVRKGDETPRSVKKGGDERRIFANCKLTNAISHDTIRHPLKPVCFVRRFCASKGPEICAKHPDVSFLLPPNGSKKSKLSGVPPFPIFGKRHFFVQKSVRPKRTCVHGVMIPAGMSGENCMAAAGCRQTLEKEE